MGLIGLIVGAFAVRIDVWRYRMDGNVRFVQNVILGAQQLAVSQNVMVGLTFDATAHRIGVWRDADGDLRLSESELVTWRALLDGAEFRNPPTTVNGALATFLNGPGVVEVANPNLPRIGISQNGSIRPASGQASGDFFVYLGAPAGRSRHARAVSVLGPTAKSTGWSLASGEWKRID